MGIERRSEDKATSAGLKELGDVTIIHGERDTFPFSFRGSVPSDSARIRCREGDRSCDSAPSLSVAFNPKGTGGVRESGDSSGAASSMRAVWSVGTTSLFTLSFGGGVW